VNDLSFKPNFKLYYYFEALLLSRDVKTSRRCDVKKDGGGVNDLPSKPNFGFVILKRYCHVMYTALGDVM